MQYFVSLGGEMVEVEVLADRVRVDGQEFHADLTSVPGTTVHSLLLDGESHRIGGSRVGKGCWELTVDGRALDVEVMDRRGKAIRDIRQRQAALAGPEPVKAPMPGLVVKVDVAVGQEVRAGEGVAVVEAMKMENELSAPADGTVEAIHAAAGDSVAKDQVLVEFKAPDSDGEAEEGEGS